MNFFKDNILDGPPMTSFLVTYLLHARFNDFIHRENTPQRQNNKHLNVSHISEMASITMAAASFLGSTTLANRSPVAGSRRIVVTKAARAAEGEKVKVNCDTKKESSNGRRDLVFAAAAAAVCSVAGMAVAAEGPKPGTPEARKIYAPVCVTMPTAKICRR
jgi:hypothetical protein